MHYRRTDGFAPIVGWAPSTVRCVLIRETYGDIVVWNKTKKRNDCGQWDPKTAQRRNGFAPRWSISGLWTAPFASCARATYQQRGQCAPVWEWSTVWPSTQARDPQPLRGNGDVRRLRRWNHRRGRQQPRGPIRLLPLPSPSDDGTCTNALRISAEMVNEAVLRQIEEEVFTPEAIETVIQLSERDDVRDDQVALAKEQRA